MLNEKLAISASLQTLFILRKMIDNQETVKFIQEKTGKMMAEGWIYDNTSE